MSPLDLSVKTVGLNRLATALRPSPTMAAAAMPSLHPDCVDLTVGEPTLAPPFEAREAAARAAREDLAHYGPVAGLPALREAVAADLTRRDGIPRRVEHVLVTPGGKSALLDALRCILNPGDEVLVFAPAWPTFLDQVRWAGGVPVLVPCGPDLLPSLQDLAAAIGPRTRAVIVNEPSNPSGVRWDRARTTFLADLALAQGLWVILDQVYGTLSFEGDGRPFLARVPELADRALGVESFSKRFAMTGYRLGVASGPASLIQAMTALGSSSHTHASMIAQHAALEALASGRPWEAAHLEALRRKRDLGCEALAGIPGVSVPRPEGGLYLFPDVSGWMARLGWTEDPEVTAWLRDDVGVKVLPGSAFGAPGRLRLSLGAPQDRFALGMARLREAFLG